jgi:hypothetical protein
MIRNKVRGASLSMAIFEKASKMDAAILLHA